MEKGNPPFMKDKALLSDIPDKKNLHAGHRERMRIRFSDNGFDNYRPHEVLEQILFEVIPRANTNETAHNLLNRFGSLENVLDAPEEELMKVHGIGARAAEYLTSLKSDFLQRCANDMRDADEFGSCELAFLADLYLSEGTRKHFVLVLVDELGRFLRVTHIKAVTGETGSIDWRTTAAQIAEATQGSICFCVTMMTELLDDRICDKMRETFRDSTCGMIRMLYLEQGALYELFSEYDEQTTL